jgi:hypothetical protein
MFNHYIETRLDTTSASDYDGYMKLDLHTHCFEDLGFQCLPNVRLVGKIVAAVKRQGLDGIAITEHHDRYCGFQVRDIVRSSLNNEVLIIPGQELDSMYQHVVELYLPLNLAFRFIAHPGYPTAEWSKHLDGIQGIEIENGQHHDIDYEGIREIAERHGLLLLSNSDAHRLKDIGMYYNELELEELYVRAQPLSKESKWRRES